MDVQDLLRALHQPNSEGSREAEACSELGNGSVTVESGAEKAPIMNLAALSTLQNTPSAAPTSTSNHQQQNLPLQPTNESSSNSTGAAPYKPALTVSVAFQGTSSGAEVISPSSQGPLSASNAQAADLDGTQSPSSQPGNPHSASTTPKGTSALPHKPTNIFVAGLPSSWDDKKLRERFQEFGDILSVRIVSSRHFGFVMYRNPEAAQVAIKGAHLTRPTPTCCALMHVTLSMHDEGADDEPSERVFIRGLPQWATKEHIRAAFSKFGHVEDCSILFNSQGHCKGAGFVLFQTIQEAAASIDGAQTVMIDNWEFPLEVKFSESPEVHQQRQERNRERFRQAKPSPSATPTAKETAEALLKARSTGAILATPTHGMQLIMTPGGGSMPAGPYVFGAPLSSSSAAITPSLLSPPPPPPPPSNIPQVAMMAPQVSMGAPHVNNGQTFIAAPSTPQQLPPVLPTPYQTQSIEHPQSYAFPPQSNAHHRPPSIPNNVVVHGSHHVGGPQPNQMMVSQHGGSILGAPPPPPPPPHQPKSLQDAPHPPPPSYYYPPPAVNPVMAPAPQVMQPGAVGMPVYHAHQQHQIMSMPQPQQVTMVSMQPQAPVFAPPQQLQLVRPFPSAGDLIFSSPIATEEIIRSLVYQRVCNINIERIAIVGHASTPTFAVRLSDPGTHFLVAQQLNGSMFSTGHALSVAIIGN